MSLFRIDPENPFKGPHQSLQAVTHGASPARAEAAMIMIHGRGATARGMIPLAEEFDQPGFHYVAPQADNHTWYPYSFLSPKDNNQPGISSGLQRIYDLIRSLEGEGIPKRKIVLLGFSQGACLATEFAARHPERYGGVVGLSGGLIGPEIDPDVYNGNLENTPVFLGCSNTDPHIPKERVNITEEVFQNLNGKVDKRIYRNMGHTVIEDEIKAIREMMTQVMEKE